MKPSNNLTNQTGNLKILHVISHYELGGAEKCTFELSQLFGGRIEMGIAAILGDDSSKVGKSMSKEARENGISIFNGVRLPWKFGGFLTAAFKLRQIVRSYKPDIVHLNTELPEFTYALCLTIAPSLKHVLVVRTIHNTILWSRWPRLGTWCEKKLGNTPVVYVSEAVRDSFQKWRATCGLRPVTSDTVIYNPITVPSCRPQLTNLRIQQKEIRLLFAGRFERQKGCDLLPEIIRQIKVPKNTLLTLTIFGEGPDEAILTQLQATPPPGWKVQVLPPSPNLVESLSDFDVLLFPSRFEGYGRLAAEAVLMGIPVVAFQLTVLFEIFPIDYPWLAPFNDNNLSEYADKTSILLSEIDHARPVIDNARKLLTQKLDPEKTASAYLQYYKNLHENKTHITS